MLLNRKAIALATDFVTDIRYAAAAQKVMNATVRLKSTGSGEFFIGSGVILGTGREVAYADSKWSVTGKQFTVIMSALHNLYMNSDKAVKIPPLNGNTVTWDQTIATNFTSSVVIDYGLAPLKWKSTPSKIATIDQVVPIFPQNIGVAGKIVGIASEASGDGQAFQLLNLSGATNANGSKSGGQDDGRTPVAGTEAASWRYDVVLLLSKDANLYAYATSGACNFMGTKTLKDLSDQLLPSWHDNANKLKVPVLGRNFRLLQLGYGNTSDPKVRMRDGTTEARPVKGALGGPGGPDVPAPVYMTLQYKRALPLSATFADLFYMNTEYEPQKGTPLILTGQSGIFLNCQGGNDSTFSGDSGGPTVAFPVAGGPEAYLVGINSGAGMALSDADARQAVGPGRQGVWEYDNNVVTSLAPICGDLPDLRFQNV